MFDLPEHRAATFEPCECQNCGHTAEMKEGLGQVRAVCPRCRRTALFIALSRGEPA